MSTENRIDYLLSQAEKLKVEGNEFFKNKAYERANTRYHRSLAYLTGLPGRESEENSLVKMASEKSSKLSKEDNMKLDYMESLIRMNIGTVYIKLAEKIKREHIDSSSSLSSSDYLRKALQSAQESLRLNPKYLKAKLRVAETFILLKRYENGLNLLEEIKCEIDQSPSKDGEKILEQAKSFKLMAKRFMQEENNKQKKAFANIFERSKET